MEEVTSHEADLQRKLQESRAEIIRLKSAAGHVGADGEHRYLSTYCMHGRHSECRMLCKICGNACLCDCGRCGSTSGGTIKTSVG